MKVSIIILFILVINQIGLSQDFTMWVQYDLGGATIKLPECFIHTRLQGIDSKVGKFECDSIIIRYDYGDFGFINAHTCDLELEEQKQLEIFNKDWFKELYNVPELCTAKFIIVYENPGYVIESKSQMGEIKVNVSKCNSDIYFGIKANNLSFDERQLIIEIGNTIRFD